MIYYFAKSIVIVLLDRYNYLKNNLSDVKEIVKDDKKGYLDEESNKTLKIRKEEEKKKNQDKNNIKEHKKSKGNKKAGNKKKNNKK